MHQFTFTYFILFTPFCNLFGKIVQTGLAATAGRCVIFLDLSGLLGFIFTIIQ